MVTLVVLNRDGAGHLRRLLAGLSERTDYPRFEMVLVDNGSSDDSLDFVRRVEAPFPISIVANPHNESFSDACNQGAQLASGELLLFLNNDIEPFERGWLRELVACLREHDGAGIAGSTLIYPADCERGFRVQHRAIRIVEVDGMLGPDRSSYGVDPLGEGFGEDADSPVAAGACVLIERDLFDQVGGFTHGFLYGGEDIDLGLKVLDRGRRVICSGRSLLIHRLGSTRAREDGEWRTAIARGNQRLILERWGPRVRREYELDRLAGGGFWAADGSSAARSTSEEEALALGFCLVSAETAGAAPGDDPLDRLTAELGRRRHRHAVLRGGEADDLRALDYDVAVYLWGPSRYLPKPGQLNVLWAPDGGEALDPFECRRYDLVSHEADAGALIDAVLARAAEIGLPTRIPADAD